MPETRPDYSLETVEGEPGQEPPALFLVRHFQIKEADYMKPPLAEQLLEPDGTSVAATATSTAGVIATSACTCNTVCTCVPVSTCTCNTICVCNTVNTSEGIVSGGGGGGGYGGYWAPCF